MVRLVFRPYTQIWRSICTSESLRASTRVSPGFTLFRHSSPSFGSQHVCSHSDRSPEGLRPADCANIQPLSLSLRTGVWHPCTRTYVRLLGPCFKTGERKPFRQDSFPTSTHCTQQKQPWPVQPQRQAHTWTRKYDTHDTGFLRFLFSNFRYSLTLFSKFFASFPHGTCTLSVSHQYLAFDGIYHPLGAAIPNNSTQTWMLKGTAKRESHPLRCPVPRDFGRTNNANTPQFFGLSSSRFSRPYWGNPG
jgi:hypothetical protein